MTTAGHHLGQGADIQIPVRDPRTRTAAERAADGDWVERPQPPAPRTAPASPGGRRPLGRRGA
ncbi:hypothetical protein ABZ626_38260 [Streptomyces longispororuber]|uniref:hypothetical protein n=1 Tax=Streptomyces longispororuber TaxID=68230 RepID=UPI0033D3BDD8